jgi:hypothetical protein
LRPAPRLGYHLGRVEDRRVGCEAEISLRAEVAPLQRCGILYLDVRVTCVPVERGREEVSLKNKLEICAAFVAVSFLTISPALASGPRMGSLDAADLSCGGYPETQCQPIFYRAACSGTGAAPHTSSILQSFPPASPPAFRRVALRQASSTD